MIKYLHMNKIIQELLKKLNKSKDFKKCFLIRFNQFIFHKRFANGNLKWTKSFWHFKINVGHCTSTLKYKASTESFIVVFVVNKILTKFYCNWTLVTRNYHKLFGKGINV